MRDQRSGTSIFTRLFIFCGTIILLLAGIKFIVNFFNQSTPNLITPIPALISAVTFKTPAPPPIPLSVALGDKIASSLDGSKGKYGIVVKDLQKGESYTLNEHQIFEPASLYKLWVMATTYQQLEKGVITEDQVLSQTIPALNSKFGIDPANAELTDGGITLSVSQALNQMITISHNYAALLLTEKIKLSTVKQFLEDNGFKESSVGSNTDDPSSTPADIALFLDKLTSGQLANAENTEKMIDLLKGQKLNNKLPKYLPESLTIAHKTGELGWFSHDAGIVYTDQGSYLITVMSESSMPSAAEERISQISKVVYDYWLNR